MSTYLMLFTLVHVLISLVAIASGFVVMYELLRSRGSRGWTAFFLATTVLTSVTGFGFPFVHVTPGHVLGVLSLIALSLALYALYSQKLVGRWRTVYVVTALIAQYFNVFVLIVQSFQKLPALRALAPTQTEWPFALVQGATLLGFVVAGYLSTARFPTAAVATSGRLSA
jgi:hypothetical protein